MLTTSPTLVSLGQDALADDPLAVGAVRAERFRIDALLGAGGMGAVYRAYDLLLEDVIALKVLRGAIAQDAAAIERFRREVRLARRVTHPNVARTFDLARCGEMRFMTMEFIDGISLARRIEQGALPLADALRVAADIARGLVAAHAAGVIHRDLKPDNVMLTRAAEPGRGGGERVVITDFGIARDALVADDDTDPARRGGRALTLGRVIGTPEYMAPEQVTGELPDGRSDVYALGVVLYELLTARVPFAGESALAIAAARLTQEPPDVRALTPAVPESVAALVAAMLSRARGERPDAGAVLAHLERLRGAHTVGAAGAAPVSVALLRATGAASAQLSQRPVRAVAVLPFGCAQPSLEGLARQLADTVADTLARVATLRVIPPGFFAEPGALAAARAQEAELALAGTVRCEGDALRVNLRCVDPALGTQRWADRVDGSLAAPFGLEDALALAAEGAIRALALAARTEVRRGPVDPLARALYDRALAGASEFTSPDALRDALAQAREAQALAPDDAAAMSLLALLLARLSAVFQHPDEALLVEAEGWALRALDADAGDARTFTALGLVRLHQSEPRESVRAFREALARDPQEPEANGYLGRFLVESGYLDEGIERLEFALRRSPAAQVPAMNLATAYGLRGDFPRASEVLVRSAARARNVRAFLILQGRMACWSRDAALAAQLVERIDGINTRDPILQAIAAAVRAVASGDLAAARDADAVGVDLAAFTPLRRSFWHQVTAERAALGGADDVALAAIEALCALPFIDLGWLDRCPLFDALRATGRFGRVRAVIAHRAAALWT